MQVFRQHIIFRLLWLFMAAHILNCSVDTPDAQPDSIPEDLSYNDMESIVEIVLENVFDIDNAIAEHDENDTEEGNSFDLKKEIVVYHTARVANNAVFDNGFYLSVSADYEERFNSQFLLEIVPPPPKA